MHYVCRFVTVFLKSLLKSVKLFLCNILYVFVFCMWSTIPTLDATCRLYKLVQCTAPNISMSFHWENIRNSFHILGCYLNMYKCIFWQFDSKKTIANIYSENVKACFLQAILVHICTLTLLYLWKCSYR